MGMLQNRSTLPRSVLHLSAAHVFACQLPSCPLYLFACAACVQRRPGKHHQKVSVDRRTQCTGFGQGHQANATIGCACCMADALAPNATMLAVTLSRLTRNRPSHLIIPKLHAYTYVVSPPAVFVLCSALLCFAVLCCAVLCYAPGLLLWALPLSQLTGLLSTVTSRSPQ
jgi:hypothetical protein